MAPQKFRKKPVETVAVQWTGDNADDVRAFMGDAYRDEFGPLGTHLITLTTVHGETAYARLGDWILPEPEPGRFYPCKPDIFAATYDLVEDAA